ncbi:hypothetical protein D6D01_05271 [Aureobasidium pullulans]|uniref:Uncharacterized protein n=1 Tax=Aureobasidium pullulans TaxID=5580 RepID=A0A4S9L7X7_AURPU|nr:hypothetical protein D6D01_05271 [Aureobasidium pullulans]
MENQTRLESWNNYCDDFVNHLRNSKAVLALLGAGLSASSGISTYQGSGLTWQGHLARNLATKNRFERDPVLVWEYYRHRQAEILSAISCTVSPAADYIDKAKEKGARIAVFNAEFRRQALRLGEEDWFFEGDAGVMVPLLLGKVVG